MSEMNVCQWCGGGPDTDCINSQECQAKRAVEDVRRLSQENATLLARVGGGDTAISQLQAAAAQSYDEGWRACAERAIKVCECRAMPEEKPIPFANEASKCASSVEFFCLGDGVSVELSDIPDRIPWQDSVAGVLQQLDGLAEQWGDEGVFRRCRDKLRALLEPITSPRQARH